MEILSYSNCQDNQNAAPSLTNIDAPTPCIECGACCASFRVSFYWGETDAAPGGTVPSTLTTVVSPHRVAMRGTEKNPVRCIALEGTVGKNVRCNIYPSRSSTCREFMASWEDGNHNPRCDHARAKHGLPPLPVPSSKLNSTDLHQ